MTFAVADRARTTTAPPSARARIVVATVDPIFAVLCKRALERASPQLVVAVKLGDLVETARQLGPDLIVLDADGEEAAALSALAAKVMLVSDASIVLTSAHLAPGSPGLCALLQSIPASFVQKPQGAASLDLAEGGAPVFVAALRAALDADDDPDQLDAGWEDAEDDGAGASA
jgi:chemotaxis response regulator CheB